MNLHLSSKFSILRKKDRTMSTLYTPCVKFVDSDGNVFQIRQVANKAMVTAVPCGYDIAMGKLPSYYPFHAHGERSDVEVKSAGVPLWTGTAEQLPIPSAAGEQLGVVSTSAQDFGVAMYSGTATGGSATTLIDETATFLSLPIAANDHVINLTQGTTSVILSVDSDIQLTVEGFEAEDGDAPTAVDDVYRILDKSAGGTGVQVVLVHTIDVDGNAQRNIAITSGLSAAAIDSDRSIFVNEFHAAEVGSSQVAQGTITCYKQGAASTVYAQIDAGTATALMTRRMVPATHKLYISGWSASCTAGKPVAIRLVANSHEGIKYDGFFQVLDSIFLESSAFANHYEVPKVLSPLAIVDIKAYAIQAGAYIAASYEGFLVPI
jgi:hypothetical protein